MGAFCCPRLKLNMEELCYPRQEGLTLGILLSSSRRLNMRALCCPRLRFYMGHFVVLDKVA
jgi:hypothetical protein